AVANLPAVAKGALEDGPTPEPVEARDGEHLVDHAGREEDAPGRDGSAGKRHPERVAVASDRGDGLVAELHARIGRELRAADAAKLLRRRAIARDEVLDVLCRRVPARPAIAEDHALSRPP